MTEGAAATDAPAKRAARISGLDGLRGVASLVVVLRHVTNGVAMPMEARRTLLEGPLAVVLNAQGAVQLFFVLSGYVLAASLDRRDGQRTWLGFWAKRVLRIHPPYVATVLLCFGASFFFVTENPGGVTSWTMRMARTHLSLEELAGTLLFPGSARGLLVQGWTLAIEMIFSFLLPLLVWLARRTHWSALLLLSGLLLMLDSTLWMLWYAIDFSVGIILYSERAALAELLGRLGRAGSTALVAAGTAVLTAPMLLGWAEPSETLGLLVTGFDPNSIVVMAVGAGLLVACAVHVPWLAALLSTRPCAFLGHVSFSLYLVHLVLVTLIAPRLATGSAWLDAAILASSVLGLSLVLSVLLRRFVEEPCIRAGAWAYTRLTR